LGLVRKKRGILCEEGGNGGPAYQRKFYLPLRGEQEPVLTKGGDSKRCELFQSRKIREVVGGGVPVGVYASEGDPLFSSAKTRRGEGLSLGS